MFSCINKCIGWKCDSSSKVIVVVVVFAVQHSSVDEADNVIGVRRRKRRTTETMVRMNKRTEEGNGLQLNFISIYCNIYWKYKDLQYAILAILASTIFCQCNIGLWNN